MRQLQLTSYFMALVISMTSLFAHSSDPQMFVYRNDSQFNSTHLRTGVNISHSTADGMFMTLQNEKGESIDIPLSVIDSCVIRTVDIPTLHFTLPDYPDVKDIWSKEDYVDAILNIEGNGYCEDIDNLQLSLRGRGNTTWNMSKKPMRMKFPKKIALFGMAKQKNYVLLANYIDASLMRNTIAYWIARRLGVPYANHTTPVNVIINGHPRGSYLITEKVGINSGSVDIDETTGILFELSGEYDEKYKFMSDPYNLPVMVKDPDFDELAEDNPDGPNPDERLEMWKEDLNRNLKQLQEGKGATSFDMNSFARGILLYNICLNNELVHPKSMYMHKENIGPETQYKFGPAWDFDASFNMMKPDQDGVFIESSPRNSLLINNMLQAIVACPEFMPVYKVALQQFATEDLPDLIAFIKNYAAQIDPSSKMDAVVWPEFLVKEWFMRGPTSDVKGSAEQLCQWLTERIEYLLEQAEQNKL